MHSLGILVVVSITYVIVRETGIVLLIGRAIGNTEKRGPAEAQSDKIAIVLPIGRAIGNTEKRRPAST